MVDTTRPRDLAAPQVIRLTQTRQEAHRWSERILNDTIIAEAAGVAQGAQKEPSIRPSCGSWRAVPRETKHPGQDAPIDPHVHPA